ncbi:unnamed protein product [Prorocentrum cordatum]|uniref:Uncharacterized protein n=1 Tax=Prorocentrum cordatum TaxID=2364126 RepID=A0ABN9PKA9_9DINO|nr:unnamed protein product [Polarella glacialis]
MAGYLANFAARGDPNGPGLPRWEQATATSEQGLPGSWMQLGPEEACMEELGPLFRARAMLLASEYFGRRLRAELRRGELAAPGGGEGRRRCTALVACQDGTGEAQEGGEGSPDRKRRCTASGEADGEKVCPAFAELGQPEQRVETERRWGGPA